MGLLGEHLRGRDVAVGVILTMSLGLGTLFLHFYTRFATQATATALLFGNVLWALVRTHCARCCGWLSSVSAVWP